MNPLHSRSSGEWYSPPHVVEMARTVLGTIELDPASCASANEVVRAERYLAQDQDGLTADWGCVRTVFLNPPGGRANGRGLPVQLWERLVREYDAGTVGAAIFVGYSLEMLQTFQHALTRSPLYYPFCVPRSRLRFVAGGGQKAPSPSPTHGNVIVYLGPARDRFADAFSELGHVVLP